MKTTCSGTARPAAANRCAIVPTDVRGATSVRNKTPLRSGGGGSGPMSCMRERSEGRSIRANVGVELKGRGTLGGERRRERKSLRNGVHHANAVVWGPVYRTRLSVASAPRHPRRRTGRSRGARRTFARAAVSRRPPPPPPPRRRRRGRWKSIRPRPRPRAPGRGRSS
eukprot:29767-Pelagococcus_subviridis.AAC.1